MDDQRRQFLQLLGAIAGTGIATTGFQNRLTDTATATADGDAELLSNDVTMDDLSYQVDYDADRFDGDNIANSGAIRYEKKKYAADPSFYTYQSGTWVNATDDASDSDSVGNTYTAGSNNSRVEIEETGSSEVNLYLANVYPYFQEEDDDNFPNKAFAEYVFDVAWDVMSNAASFYVPPSPPLSIGSEGSETGTERLSGTKMRVTFTDPVPNTEEKFQVTHAVDWKWEVGSGGITPGWNYVGANRLVDNGEWQWNVYAGKTFGPETEHQLNLVSAFCIYQEDETACETPDCSPNYPCPDAETTVAGTDRDCCQLTDVRKPLPVTNQHLEAARGRADEVASQFDSASSSQFDRQAAVSRDQAGGMDSMFRELVAYRSASAHGKGATARNRGESGDLDVSTVVERATSVRTDVRSIRDQIAYTGERLDQTVAAAAQVEKSLVSAQTWIQSAQEAREVDHLSGAESAKYGAAAAEFARGNLEDAKNYQAVADGLDSAGRDFESELEARYETLAARVPDEMPDVATDDHVEYAVRNVRGYRERAATRREDGFLAAAVLDLLYADAYAAAADRITGLDLSDVNVDRIEAERELTADRYNRLASSIESPVQRFLLRLASLEYNSATESFGGFSADGHTSDGERALAHLAATESVLDAAKRVKSTLDVEKSK